MNTVTKKTESRLNRFERRINEALAETARKKAARERRRKQAKVLVSLRTFAVASGVRVKPCGPGWGGRWGYIVDTTPNAMTCGYHTVTAAHEAWAIDTFGQKTAEALFLLLDHQYTPPST